MNYIHNSDGIISIIDKNNFIKYSLDKIPTSQLSDINLIKDTVLVNKVNPKNKEKTLHEVNINNIKVLHSMHIN